MRHLRSLIKYILIFSFGAVAAAIISFTAVSYYAVEHLTLAKPTTQEVSPENTWINANILDVLRVGDQYALELNQFEELRSQMPQEKAPPLCDVICSASSFDKERMLEERTPYLKDFYQQNGERALRDPFFQLKLREVGFLAEIFPSSFRRVWVDVGHKREAHPSLAQKLRWSFQFELAALGELTRFPSKWEELQKESHRIQGFRELIHSCQKGLRPAKDLQADCQRL